MNYVTGTFKVAVIAALVTLAFLYNNALHKIEVLESDALLLSERMQKESERYKAQLQALSGELLGNWIAAQDKVEDIREERTRIVTEYVSKPGMGLSLEAVQTLNKMQKVKRD